MFDTTVADACEMLGIGKTRVHQLIKSGVLEAEKIGNTWLIDGRSIEARKKAGARAGRPPANLTGPALYHVSSWRARLKGGAELMVGPPVDTESAGGHRSEAQRAGAARNV